MTETAAEPGRPPGVVAYSPLGALSYNGLKPLLIGLERSNLEAVELNFSKLEFAGPGAMVPLIAIVSSLRARGVPIEITLPATRVERAYFDKAGWTVGLTGVGETTRRQFRQTFLPVVRFADHRTLNAAITAALNIVSGVAIYPPGVLKAIEWTLNEVADNVLVHAGHEIEGWLQVIATPKNGRIAFTVADTGRGIWSSLRERYAELESDQDALDKAILPGVTRDSRIGQGNGLAGSVRIAQAMNGWVNLLSGRGELRLMDDGRSYSQASPLFQGTVVDLTLPTATGIDVADALWGREPTSTLELAHAAGDSYSFVVRVETSGFGNRASGLEVANKLANLLNELGSDRITVDFTGVEFVSASFIDEFLAKLIKRFGVGTFLARVQLTNMTSLVGRTVNAVVAQRMAADDT